MMLSTIFAGLLAASVSVNAAPTTNMAKREVGGVLICQGANATGTCYYEKYTLEDCHDLPYELSRNAATFAPDGENFFCYPRVGKCANICTSPTGCTFGSIDFHSAVKYDLTSIKWQTIIESFDCHLNTTTS